MIENRSISLKIGTSFFQVVFTILAVLCTLQSRGQLSLDLPLSHWPLTWLTWNDGVWDLIVTAFCAWVVLPLICCFILALIIIVPFLIILILGRRL